MKTFTILEALKEISILFPSLNLDCLTSICYEDGSKNKFILRFVGAAYFVNLDNQTFKLI